MKRIPRDVAVHVFTVGRHGVRFLMLRRPPRRGGFWQGVTGAPHHGETDADAAVREVREETGFDVTGTIRFVPVGYAYQLRPDRAAHWHQVYGPGVTTITVSCFGAGIPSARPPTLDPGEHDDFRWCTYDEAFALLDWPIEQDALDGRRDVLRALAESIRATHAVTPAADP